MKTANVQEEEDSKFFYGWIVLATTFLALFAAFGIRGSFGSYVTSWEQEFSISRTSVTIISLVSFIVVAIAQPLVGKFNDRFGSRTVLTVSLSLTGMALLLCSIATSLWQLIVLYGVVASFAFTGASQITSATLMTHWFTAKRGLVIGVATSGMAAGNMTIAPVTLYLISNYNWRFSLGLFGLMIIFIFAPLMAFLIRSKPADMGLKPYGETSDALENHKPATSVAGTNTGNQSVWLVLREKKFWLLTAPYFICGFTDVGLVYTHYIPYTQGSGFSIGIIGFTFSLIAVTNIIGSIGSGYLADRMNRSKLLALVYLFRAFTFPILLIANEPWHLILFALTYGIVEMASIAPTSSICADLFGTYSFGVVIGVVSISHMLGGAIGSLIPGIFYDTVHSYIPVFIMSSIMLVISAVVVLGVRDDRELTKMEV
jgi:sugar phosphate permease